jgi:hypothetical protein
VTVRRPGASKADLPLEGRRLPVKKIKGGIRFVVPRLDQHALIVVR